MNRKSWQLIAWALVLPFVIGPAHAGGPLCAALSDQGVSDLELIAAYEKKNERQLEAEWLTPTVLGWLAQRASQIRAEVGGKLTNAQIIQMLATPQSEPTKKASGKE